MELIHVNHVLYIVRIVRIGQVFARNVTLLSWFLQPRILVDANQVTTRLILMYAINAQLTARPAQIRAYLIIFCAW